MVHCRRALWAVALLCLAVPAQAVSQFGEVGELQDAVDDQLSALFDDQGDDSSHDLGESVAPAKTAGRKEVKTISAESAADDALQEEHRRVSYDFKHAVAPKKHQLGEPKPELMLTGTEARASDMIRLGAMLESITGRSKSHRTEAVESLRNALQTKLLMDELKPSQGSFDRKSHSHDSELGDEFGSEGHKTTFMNLLGAKKQDMLKITSYLLKRKQEGRPLTTKEDNALQKFYYNRASTILKKIVLLKGGDISPSEKEANTKEEAHEINQPPTAAEKRAAIAVKFARAHAKAVVEKLKLDAKIAHAEASYNRKMLKGKERRMKAAEEERKSAEQQEVRAAKEKLSYDQKVANADEHYNEALSDELLQRKKRAEVRVAKAAKQKQEADVAAARATAAAREADQEATEAEEEAEQATKHAEELQEKQLEKNKNTSNNKHQKGASKPTAEQDMPISVVPQVRLAGMLRYLRSALDNKEQITPQEQELMQSFFLKRGSSLLSELAEVDPDATWHSRGVMREEQYEMDRAHPDQLSKEWGSKNLKDDTVVTDFVHDALWAKPSHTDLARPGAQQIVGLFGSSHKVPLKFAPDDSNPDSEEPDLGESDDVEDTQTAYPGTMSTMMGLGN